MELIVPSTSLSPNLIGPAATTSPSHHARAESERTTLEVPWISVNPHHVLIPFVADKRVVQKDNLSLVHILYLRCAARF